jgi:hypothetical protein
MTSSYLMMLVNITYSLIYPKASSAITPGKTVF